MPFISKHSLTRLQAQANDGRAAEAEVEQQTILINQQSQDIARWRRDLTELTERHTSLLKRYRALVNAHQQLQLQAGLKGFETVELPPVPAQAGRIVLRKLRSTDQ